ncbi:unnamed protein product [Tilletia controversa]|uniref:Mitochondrial import inner membrane translocase subunit TIM17 n=3 Tax=Tilletia TaxID=13289 RepID=A0A8X7STZ5_9BASI|nr:hypothetical protein CF336_g7250 [Tilletia laevis]KAE8187638.1 hypothetical protein CF328_g6853 [Tilletia controversa]KAE8249608.1 hypothetical protein A4X03_0g6586 [Tilletia caries]KAE8189584.1 hypothetical protein CF335_g6592 [Tilletia laevis]KAE8241231.1 hypothetical protein A4X06_0g7617 [Tilletia controversa]
MPAGRDYSRDPCPWVILTDSGGAFAVGAVLGSVVHGVSGARNAPKGFRLPSAAAAIKARTPVMAGNFGIWGALFSSYECMILGVRQKHDAWNSISAGFCTGATLALRSGPARAIGLGVQLGVFMGVIEGAAALIGRWTAENQRQTMMSQAQQAQQQQSPQPGAT